MMGDHLVERAGQDYLVYGDAIQARNIGKETKRMLGTFFYYFAAFLDQLSVMLVQRWSCLGICITYKLRFLKEHVWDFG